MERVGERKQRQGELIELPGRTSTEGIQYGTRTPSRCGEGCARYGRVVGSRPAEKPSACTHTSTPSCKWQEVPAQQSSFKGMVDPWILACWLQAFLGEEGKCPYHVTMLDRQVMGKRGAPGAGTETRGLRDSTPVDGSCQLHPHKSWPGAGWRPLT